MSEKTIYKASKKSAYGTVHSNRHRIKVQVCCPLERVCTVRNMCL